MPAHNFPKSTHQKFKKYNFAGRRANTIRENNLKLSRQLHEPATSISDTDPVTGEDIKVDNTTPFLKNGSTTVFFKCDENRNRYNHYPYNRPSLQFPFPKSFDDD